jgi:conjugal transfer pilus assembly protein TraE
MARHIISLSTTYSPATARGQFDELLELYAPETYPTASESWYSLGSQVEETRVSSVFYLERIVLASEESIEVYGTTQQFANEMEIQKSPRCYRIRYRLDNGRFYLLQLEEKSGQKYTKEDSHAG